MNPFTWIQYAPLYDLESGPTDPCDEVFYLAVVAVTATPTANNLLLMTELAGGNKAAMSTCIFLQYGRSKVKRSAG